MFDCLKNLTGQDIARLRFLSMFILLLGGVVSGYLASSRFGLSENLAKKIMTVVLLCFSWPIALLIIWQMNLTAELIWLPIIGAVLMLLMTAVSAACFSFHKLPPPSRLTLILAGGLSNLGYTGGAFICYALLGLLGLAMAQLYLVLWIPLVYLVFFPLLKLFELRSKGPSARFPITQVFDFRMLVTPAVIAAVLLNLAGIKSPSFVARFHIVDILVYTASALSFFAIGLRVTFGRLKNYLPLYFSLGAVKFILTPLAALFLLHLLALSGRNLSSLARNVIIVQSVTPCAVVMVTISNVFDLDGPLASAVWVINTATFAVIVVPVLFFIFT